MVAPKGVDSPRTRSIRRGQGWSVVANYYDFEQRWLTGTHYHLSYGDNWADREKRELQLRKLSIPRGDREYASGVLHLMQELREAHAYHDIGAYTAEVKKRGHPVLYFAPGEAIVVEHLPRHHYVRIPAALIRDLLAELDWFSVIEGLDARSATDAAESLRRRGVRLVWDTLGSQHPSVTFVRAIGDEFRQDCGVAELKEWARRFRKALVDALV